MPDDESTEKALKRARNTAYRILTVRPRSRAELIAKLRDREFPEDIVAQVLDDLIRFGYVNDREFARSWAASRVRLRGFGRRRIEQELRTKGISRDIIHDVLADLFEEAPEIETARHEAEKKLRTLGRFDLLVRKRRLAGHLERKGFSSEIIRLVLGEMRTSEAHTTCKTFSSR